MKTFQTISRDDIRNLCIREGYYTIGDNESYENMLEKADVVVYSGILNKIHDITEDIYSHTDTPAIASKYGCSEEEIYQDIYFKVGQCVRFHCEVAF